MSKGLLSEPHSPCSFVTAAAADLAQLNVVLSPKGHLPKEPSGRAGVAAEPQAVPTTWSWTENTGRAGIPGGWQVRGLALGARPPVASQLHSWIPG